jgi:hypothetical protein
MCATPSAPSPVRSRSGNLALSLAVGAAVAVLFLLPHLPSPRPQVFDSAYEHANIAAALAQGRGFSDPFGTPSGPTAWVPPGYASVLAAAFALFGVRSPGALYVVLGLDAVFAGVAAYFLLRALDFAGRPRAKVPCALALVGYASLQLAVNGSQVRPGWFLTMQAAALLASACALWRSPSRGSWWAVWVAVALLSPLSHPGIALACAVVAGVVWLGNARAGRGPGGLLAALAGSSRGPLLVAAALAVSVVAWGLRNFVVFHRVVPMKPTGWFELDLSQEHTRAGVLDFSAIALHHPFSNVELRASYTRLGETRFLEPYHKLGLRSVTSDYPRFIQFVLNRASNALALCEWKTSALASRLPLRPRDEDRLAAAGLAGILDGRPVVWLCLDLSPGEFAERTRPLGLSDPERAFRSWLETKAEASSRFDTPLNILGAFAISGLPTLAFLLVVLFRRVRVDTATVFAALIYLVALLPNILITHDASHQPIFVALQAVLVASLVAAVLEGRGSPGGAAGVTGPLRPPPSLASPTTLRCP